MADPRPDSKKKLTRAQARLQRKEVRNSSAPPAPIDDQWFAWSAADIDHEHDGLWDWNLTPAEAAELLTVLEDLAKLRWREVWQQRANGHFRHHFQSAQSVCQEAQRRLEERQLDLERLFRLRHGSTLRIWGHLVGPVFRIIWYDRDHKVYPTEPNS